MKDWNEYVKNKFKKVTGKDLSDIYSFINDFTTYDDDTIIEWKNQGISIKEICKRRLDKMYEVLDKFIDAYTKFGRHVIDRYDYSWNEKKLDIYKYNPLNIDFDYTRFEILIKGPWYTFGFADKYIMTEP
jgi:hypothetical protein